MQSFVRSSSIRRKFSIVTFAGLSLVAFSACGEGDDEIPTRAKFRSAPTMTITPKASTLTVGGTQQLTGTVRDGDGNVINTPITWTSSDPDVVTVSTGGMVTAVAPGNGSVVASAENGARISASFSVLGASSSAVTIEGPTGLLAVGTSRQLTATAFDANNNPMPATITWTSSNPGAVAVNGAGVLIGQGPGNATITASAGGASSTFNVSAALLTLSMAITPTSNVVAPGSAPVQLSAIPRDGFGNPINLPVTWTLTKVNSPITLSSTGLLTVPAGTKGSAVVTASVTDEGGTTTLNKVINPLLHGTPLTGLSGSNSGSNADDAHYYIDVPPGRTSLSFVLSGGSNDPDLYVYRPGATSAACAPFLGNGATETCTFSGAANVPAGIWRVRIEGFSSTWAGWTLTTTMAPAP